MSFIVGVEHCYENAEWLNGGSAFLFAPCPSVNGAQGGYDLNKESCAVNLLNLDFLWLLRSLLLQLPHTSQVPVRAEAV